MNDFFTSLTSTFNNRQIAIGIWLFVLAIFAVLHTGTRSSLWQLLKSLFAPKLVLFFGTVGLAVVALCQLLEGFGVWETDQIAATVLWFLFSGTVMAGQALSVKEDDGHFKGLFWGSLKVTGAFEFIVVAYPFSLLTEIVLAPVLVLLGAMLAIANGEERFAPVKKLVELALIAVMIAFLWKSISEIWTTPEEFFTTKTGRNFFLPIFLTIGCIPIFYFWYCYSHIEGARIQINFKKFQSDELKSYARKRFFLTFMARPWLLRRATRQFQIMPARQKADVDQIVRDILAYEREADSVPLVDNAKGWSPYLAREFLGEHGLRTADYHCGHDDEYWAGSDYIDLDDTVMPNNATFYIEGERDLVRTLKLTGKFVDDFSSEEALEKFRELSGFLCEKALGENEIDMTSLVPDRNSFEQCQYVNGTEVKAWAKRYPNDRGSEVFVLLSRGMLDQE